MARFLTVTHATLRRWFSTASTIHQGFTIIHIIPSTFSSAEATSQTFIACSRRDRGCTSHGKSDRDNANFQPTESSMGKATVSAGRAYNMT